MRVHREREREKSANLMSSLFFPLLCPVYEFSFPTARTKKEGGLLSFVKEK
jgi:hypothetical protein